MILGKIPISYNIRSIKARFTSTIVSIIGIAGVVTVFLGMLALANGFRQTMIASGSPDNAIICRAGSTSEMSSSVSLDEFKIIRDMPEVRRDNAGNALATAELVVIIPLKMKATGTEANVQVRGISGDPALVRNNVKLREGRMFESGKPELVIGSEAYKLYDQTDVGSELKIGGRTWTVVGIFDAGGTAFDSEVWSDSVLIAETFNRPTNYYSSVTVKLASNVDVRSFDDRLKADPRLNLSAQSEVAYYSEKSQMMANLITTLGYLIVSVMGFGAVFAALNTMSSTISARGREIATLRSLGFSRSSIVVSFVIESVMIALLGGILGCILVLPVNGYQASTMNWGTFSHLGFSLKLTYSMMISGLVFAAVMGLIGGLLPATHAARKPIVNALREM